METIEIFLSLLSSSEVRFDANSAELSDSLKYKFDLVSMNDNHQSHLR